MIELGIVTLAFVVIFYIRETNTAKERRDLLAERSELLNRIKPETAQIPNVASLEIVEPVRSDEDYWEAHENQVKEAGTYPYGYEEEPRGR